MLINLIRFFLLLLAATTSALIMASENSMDNKPDQDDVYILPANCDFLKVKNNISQETLCSPKLGDPLFSDFVGLLINGPEKIVWPKNVSDADFTSYPNGTNDGPLRFMIAGLANIPDSEVGVTDDVAAEVLVVAINNKTKHVYSGKMNRFGSIKSRPEVVKTITDIPKTVFFNIDLVTNAGVPIVDATYTVYATFGKYKSNVLYVNTIVK